MGWVCGKIGGEGVGSIGEKIEGKRERKRRKGWGF